MQPIKPFNNLLRATRQKVRYYAVAGTVLFGGAGATAWGANAASASPVNDDPSAPSALIYDEEVSNSPTYDHECGLGVEMDPCPTTTTTTGPTTTSTSTAPTTTSTSTTSTTQPEEVCDDELNVAFRAAFDEEFEKIARYRGYESYDDIPADVVAQIDWEAFWNTALAMKNQFGFADQEELLRELALCDICPPLEAPAPPTTTTAPPTTTTAPPTTTTALPTTTTSTTSTTALPTTTTALPTTTTSTTSTTAPPTTYPMGPAPELPGTPSNLPRTGSGVLGLVQTGGGLLAAGAAASGIAYATRRKGEKDLEGDQNEGIAAGGPDPDLEQITETEIAALDATDLGNIVPQAEKSVTPVSPNVGLETLRRASERLKALTTINPIHLPVARVELPVNATIEPEVPKLEIIEFSNFNRTKLQPSNEDTARAMKQIRSGRDSSMITPVGATPTSFETTPNALLPAALRDTNPMANYKLLGSRYLER